MPPDLAADLAAFRRSLLRSELSSQLTELRDDPDIFGFAVEVPEDLGNLSIMTAVGRESNLVGEQPDSAVWLRAAVRAGGVGRLSAERGRV